MRTLIFVAVILFCLTAAVLADVVHMTDGRKIKGKIVNETDDFVLLKGKYGEVKLQRHEIDHIEYGPVEEEEKEEQKQPQPKKPKPKPKPKPKKTVKNDLSALVDKAAQGDKQAAKKLMEAKRASLVPIAKKLKEAEGEEEERLEKLRDEIEEKTQAEKAAAEKHLNNATKELQKLQELKKSIGANVTAADRRKVIEITEKAGSELEKAFELDPSNEVTLQAVTALYYRSKMYGKAIPYLKINFDRKPNDQDVLQMLASSYMNLKKFKDARKLLEKILERDSGNATGWANIGVVELSEKKYDKAIEAFEKSIKLGLDTGGIRHNLGIAYKKKKDWLKAAENFQKAVEKEPKNGQALIELGSAWANAEEYAKAAEAWGKFCELYPKTAQAKQLKKEIVKLKKKAEKKK